MHVEERRNVPVPAFRISGTRGAGTFTSPWHRRVGIAVCTFGTGTVVTAIDARNGLDPRKHANGRGRSFREPRTCPKLGLRAAGRDMRGSRSRPPADCGRLVPGLSCPPVESRHPAPLNLGGPRFPRARRGNARRTRDARVRPGVPAGGHRCSALAGLVARTGNRTHETARADRAGCPASARGSFARSRAARGSGRRAP